VASFGHEVSDGYAADRHGFSLAAYVNRPTSRGEVHLARDREFRPVTFEQISDRMRSQPSYPEKVFDFDE
jgi:hypothetical protein